MTVTRTKPVGITYVESSKSEDDKIEQPKEDQIEGYEMILGSGHDKEEVRNEWIDATERIFEEESWEKGQMHARRNFDYASVHNEERFTS